jgi:acetyl-CoA C-acetyltransferase
MVEAYIYDAVRTPRGKGKPDGSLHEATALHLATTVLKAVRDRNALDTSLVDDVVFGIVSPVNEQGSDLARIAVLNADYAETVAGVQINRFCASGLEATNMAAAQVMAGQSDFAIGGGVESMSRVPMGSDGGAWSSDPSIAFKSYFTPQGIGADRRFDKSIVPVKDQIGLTLLDRDEHMRAETTMQSLASLNASFAQLGESMGFDAVALQRYPEIERIDHVHHAGNSSGIVDGAAAILIGTKEAGEKAGLKPRARIRAFGSIGSEPSIMLTGPEKVTRKVLARAGMKPSDIDLYELNEAFASVVLLFMKLLEIPHDKINVNGGAIAMGHPLGATGAMILGTLLDEMERRDVATGLATLCVGAGMGTATIIERL